MKLSAVMATLLRLGWTAGMDFALAATFLITWIAPDTFGEKTVHKLTFMMLLEFLVVHSTGFLGALAARDMKKLERVLMTGALLLFYVLMAGGFCAMYGGWWPLIAFTALTAPKLVPIFFSPYEDEDHFWVMGSWAAMTALYLFSIFATLAYDIPPLGVTPEVIAAQEFSVGGEWPEQPYRVMALGALYFTGLGLFAIISEIWGALARKKKVARDS